VNRAAYAVAGLAVALTLMFGSGAASAQTGGAAPGGTTTTPAPATPTTPSAYSQVFPIESSVPHRYGDGFGAGRGTRRHMGQDVFAACGSMLVAVAPSRVIYKGVQSSAGNYVVIRSKALHQDFAYMHLQSPAPVTKGQILATGQFLGAVGDTGNARGCHLHFEIWQGKWYRGGSAVDPLSTLQWWDSYS